jgi:hypothetical protein
MKKALAISVGLVFALACADSVTEPGADQPAPVFSKGAVVHKDVIGCALLDGSGNWFPGDFSLPCGLEVATFAKGMNATLAAQATGVPNTTGRTVHWGPWNTEGTDWAAGYDGTFGLPDLNGPPYPCYVLGTEYDIDKPLFTMNWKAHVTRSGKASLVCHYSEKWAFDCDDWDNCAED